MLQTLFKILSWDIPSPEILLEPDGDICLDWSNPIWHRASVSINPAGGVNWCILNGPDGTDIDELHRALDERMP